MISRWGKTDFVSGPLLISPLLIPYHDLLIGMLVPKLRILAVPGGSTRYPWRGQTLPKYQH